jgi:hypothetical protein
MRALAAAALLVGLPAVAHAAEWDTIRPGVTTQEAVRAHLGQPAKVGSAKVEGYDTAEWLYEGANAPRGMARVVVHFGLLTPQGYRADVVRMVRAEPRRGVFPRSTVIMGWGPPQRVGKEKDQDVFFYEAGLLVYFDKEGRMAETMIFTPPQRQAEGAAPPPR